MFAMPRWTSRSSASRVTLSLAPFFMVLLFVKHYAPKTIEILLVGATVKGVGVNA